MSILDTKFTPLLHEIHCTYIYNNVIPYSVVTRALGYFLLLTSDVHREAWTPVLLLCFTRILQLTESQVSPFCGCGWVCVIEEFREGDICAPLPLPPSSIGYQC